MSLPPTGVTSLPCETTGPWPPRSHHGQTARGAGLYESTSDMQTLLALFELEKALYELRYELHNRPDWVRWPLAGITGLVPAT